ncbi:MAG TPA: SusF/SusE family outer membrane protein [Saprospiraceae bacterium]|nr:SusF/SusE family outer membrane protein [Saprospiraceae bacterium]HQW55081.1 SusF/SusE family outer membrane protein [Saprospiraceae bacterium]
MKNIINITLLLLIVGVFFTACKKYDDLEVFGPGKPVVLTSSATTVAAAPSDSDAVVLTLSWTNPAYSTSESNYKFVIEMAEAGTNFANPSQTTVVGLFKKDFTAKAINMILSGMGYLYGEAHDVEIRVVSSYLNNNEQYISNLLTTNMTAYKDPSTVIEATTMNVIGEAAAGWDTDVPLNLIGTRRFAGVVNMQWGKEWKLRRDAGDWTLNWGLADGVTFELGKALEMKKAGANFKLPDGTGSADFQIVMDIDANTVIVIEVKSTMNIIGDGAAGWDTDVPMTNLGGGKFSLITNLTDKEIKFRAIPGDWSINFGIAEGETFTFGSSFQLAANGNNIKIPTAGKYKIEMNLATNSAKITASNFPDNLYLVGGGTPADWNPANSLPFRKLDDGKFEIYSPITADGEFKFLEVQDWAGDWGDSKVTHGQLEQNDEQNCSEADAGFYKINCDFTTGLWTALKTDWGLIGSATPGGWDADTNMDRTSDFTWTVTLNLTVGEIKFRANDGWDINFGDSGADGTLESGGDNIAVSEAGNYTVTMTLAPGGYTYELKKN